MIRRLILATAVLGACAGTPLFADEAEEPTASDPRAGLCEALGPGYRHVPGTDTCLKVEGYVTLDVVTSRTLKSPPPTAQDAWSNAR